MGSPSEGKFPTFFFFFKNPPLYINYVCLGGLSNEAQRGTEVTPDILLFDSDSKTWTKTGEMMVKR